VALGCASRVDPPGDVSEGERRSVEVQVAEVSLVELERGANRRYWEMLLTDSAVIERLPATERDALRSMPVHERVNWLDARALDVTGFVPLTVIRTDTGPLRAAATPQGIANTTSLAEAATDPGVLRRVIARRVRAVGVHVAGAAGMPRLRFLVDAGFGANAGAPFGFFETDRVYVGSELVLLAGSDDELACVIGHEIAHISEGHTRSAAWADLGKKAVSLAAAFGFAALLPADSGDEDPSAEESDLAVGMGSIAGVLVADLPLLAAGWERGQEREADAAGLRYAQRAGFDPGACERFMFRMACHEHTHGVDSGAYWWSTHPATAERVIYLRELGARARAGAPEEGL
jgi:Zn-dependent protease with chaperone function